MTNVNELVSAVVQSKEAMGLLAFVIAAVLCAVVLWVAAAVQKDARVSKLLNVWKLALPYASDLMLAVRTEGIDMGEALVAGKIVDYNELAASSEERLGRKFDARMLYVIDMTEDAIFKRIGVKFEFDKFWPRFEAEYQKLRLGNNGIVMNDKDIVEAQNGPAMRTELIIETDAERQRRSLAQRARREAERLAKEAQAVAVADLPAAE